MGEQLDAFSDSLTWERPGPKDECPGVHWERTFSSDVVDNGLRLPYMRVGSTSRRAPSLGRHPLVRRPGGGGWGVGLVPSLSLLRYPLPTCRSPARQRGTSRPQMPRAPVDSASGGGSEDARARGPYGNARKIAPDPDGRAD
jgi:hypothetical protein